MAIENVPVKNASGVSTGIAADQVGDIYYPVTKIDVGADGSAALLSPSTPLPVAHGQGLSIFRHLDLDETKREVKSTAGRLCGWFITNRSAADIFVKFYNSAASGVTIGSTTPVLTFCVPGNSVSHVGAAVLSDRGITFSSGITVACLTGVADSNTSGPAANECVANIFYE